MGQTDPGPPGKTWWKSLASLSVPAKDTSWIKVMRNIRTQTEGHLSEQLAYNLPKYWGMKTKELLRLGLPDWRQLKTLNWIPLLWGCYCNKQLAKPAWGQPVIRWWGSIMTNCWTPKAAWLWKRALAEMPARVTGIWGYQGLQLTYKYRKKGLTLFFHLSEMVEMVSNIYKEKKKGPIFSLSC